MVRTRSESKSTEIESKHRIQAETMKGLENKMILNEESMKLYNDDRIGRNGE